MNRFAFPALALVASLSACAADTSETEPAADEGATTEDLSSGKHHYEPGAPEIVWKPGCGMQRPDGTRCEMGLFLTYTRQYIDLQVTKKVTLDKGAKLITVKLDTWSKSTVHPMVAVSPQTEPLDVPGAQMNVTYDTRVVDWKGKVLSTGTVHMVPAP